MIMLVMVFMNGSIAAQEEPTAVVTLTEAPTLTPLPTETFTGTPTPAPTETATTMPSETPTLSPTEPPTLEATIPLTETAAPTLTLDAAPTPSETPDTFTETPTAEATYTETPTLTASPSETPTSGVTFTETSTITPENILGLFLSNSFDDGNTTFWRPGSGWTLVASGSGQAISLPESDDAFRPRYGTFGDIAIQSRFALPSGILRVTLRQSLSGEYSVFVDSTGYISLQRNGVVLYVASHLIDPGNWHTLRFSAIGNLLQVSIDGMLIISEFDPMPLPSGGISFTAFNATHALVDDVEIWTSGAVSNHETAQQFSPSSSSSEGLSAFNTSNNTNFMLSSDDAIAYTSIETGINADLRLYSITSAGTLNHNFTQPPAFGISQTRHPEWSPNRQFLAYDCRTTEFLRNDLCVALVDQNGQQSGLARMNTDSATTYSGASWSLDSQYIAYFRGLSHTYDRNIAVSSVSVQNGQVIISPAIRTISNQCLSQLGFIGSPGASYWIASTPPDWGDDNYLYFSVTHSYTNFSGMYRVNAQDLLSGELCSDIIEPVITETIIDALVADNVLNYSSFPHMSVNGIGEVAFDVLAPNGPAVAIFRSSPQPTIRIVYELASGAVWSPDGDALAFTIQATLDDPPTPQRLVVSTTPHEPELNLVEIPTTPQIANPRFEGGYYYYLSISWASLPTPPPTPTPSPTPIPIVCEGEVNATTNFRVRVNPSRNSLEVANLADGTNVVLRSQTMNPIDSYIWFNVEFDYGNLITVGWIRIDGIVLTDCTDLPIVAYDDTETPIISSYDYELQPPIVGWDNLPCNQESKPYNWVNCARIVYYAFYYQFIELNKRTPNLSDLIAVVYSGELMSVQFSSVVPYGINTRDSVPVNEIAAETVASNYWSVLYEYGSSNLSLDTLTSEYLVQVQSWYQKANEGEPSLSRIEKAIRDSVLYRLAAFRVLNSQSWVNENSVRQWGNIPFGIDTGYNNLYTNQQVAYCYTIREFNDFDGDPNNVSAIDIWNDYRFVFIVGTSLGSGYTIATYDQFSFPDPFWLLPPPPPNFRNELDCSQDAVPLAQEIAN